MSGIDYIADTNAVVYLLNGNECMKPYLGKKLGVSVISVMELLSFPEITDAEDKKIRAFLDRCEVLQITDDVKERTIQFRRKKKVKLPDAIIASSAMAQGKPLITADTGLFHVDGLQLEKLNP